MFLIGTSGPSPAQQAVPRRHKMFLPGTRCSSAQDVPLRHKMFIIGAASGPLAGARSSSSAQQAVPRRRRKWSLVGTKSSSPAQDVPHRHKRSLIGAFGKPCFSPGVPGDASKDIGAFEEPTKTYSENREGSSSAQQQLAVPRRHKMSLAGTGCGPSPAQDVPRRRRMRSLAGTRYSSPGQDVSRRLIAFSQAHCFLAGTTCSSPAQDVPHRRKMFLAGARCSSPAQDVPRRRSKQQAVPHRRSNRKRSLMTKKTSPGCKGGIARL
jgi:hypothetical protein